MTPEKKKKKPNGHEEKLLANREAANLFNQITISNGEEATQKLNLFNGEEETQKFNLFNQISNEEEATQKFNLYRCQQKKKKKSVPPNQKGKGIVEPEPEPELEPSNNNNTEQMDADQPMATHFQEEILMDILNRLPVQSLLRFKCVSKFWETLISEPYFKMKHLNHAKNDQNSQKILISQLYPDGISSMYCFTLSSVQLVEDVQTLDYPSSFKPWCCILHCCWDGLVIIQVASKINVKRPILLLWNPSTRESIVLPDPEFPLVGGTCLGLGYDSTSGDYKILKIDNKGRGHKAPGEILALKGGRWRNIDKHPLDITNVFIATRSLALVHEAFHWIVVIGDCTVVRRKYSLVSFSISNEVYGEIPLPEQVLRSTHDFTFGVSVLEGMLCVYSTSAWQVEEGFKVWVLKDYGVKESWNLLFTIDYPLIYLFIPKYRFADGEVLFWFSYVKSHEKAFRTSSGPFVSWPQSGHFDGIAFTESLISPKSLTY